MQTTAERQFAYFQDLEHLTRSGLAAYIIVLILGLLTSVMGANTATRFLLGSTMCERLLLVLVSINLVYVLVRIIDAIHWLGEVHVWLDRILFRFLPKSNRIVMSEIVTLLDVRDRSAFEKRSASERATMTQSILTDLAEDQSIFESLLQRKIFQSWIWYWITLYGVTVLLLLTLVSLVMSWLHPNTSTWVLCSSIATVAALHLILGVGLGYKILKITRRIVQEIIHLHRQTVASMLRDQIHRTGAQAT